MTPGRLAQIACILEATARKPGNVHRFADFHDASYLDFLLSAAALVEPLDRARETGVGVAVLAAVEATRELVATNTNLGMILLLAPLAAVPEQEDLREGVTRVLDALTIDDARLAYQAIRLATPGGLGSSPDQDIAAEPTIPLRDVMRLAADRDAIARQYANGFADVFDLVVPALGDRPTLEAGIIRAFLATLARLPDTLIARKRGMDVAREASRQAAVLVNSAPCLRLADCREFDRWLRADGHARNPGTTADLTAAALFVALRERRIRLPLRPNDWSDVPGSLVS